MKNLVRLSFIIVTFAAISQPYAQRRPIIADSLSSKILKQQRHLQVVLPPDYDSTRKYDVLYLLDGDWNTEMTTQIQGFLRESGFMPQNIVVGIRHVSRDKELTPTGSDNPAAFGGAGLFLSFIEKELIPFVEKKYPASGSNALFGHSFGGLFVMYALVTSPQLFDIYIAADPSFWWDRRYMKNFVREKLDPSRLTNKVLYITGRGGQESEGMGIPSIDSVLRSGAFKGLRWKVADYAGETHNSIKFKSIYDGLKFAYEGYNVPITAHPMNGIVVKGKPFKLWVFNSSAVTMRYTVDGTEPVLSSPLVKPETVLDGPARVVIKSFAANRQYDKSIQLLFVEGAPLRGVARPENVTQGGWRYQYFEGIWDSLPDFSKLKPVQTGIAGKDFNFSRLPRKTDFGCVFEGYIEITEEGYYIFGIDSDDGSKLFLGNQLLINHDGLHANGNDRSFLLPLQKGFYPIRIEYFQREGGAGLNLIYVPPNIPEPRPAPIPVERQYY